MSRILSVDLYAGSNRNLLNSKFVAGRTIFFCESRCGLCRWTVCMTLFISACFCRTWSGPSWTAALNLQTMLQSIQSLMSVAALTNEPGFEKLKPSDPQVVSYDRFVRHETIRVAVIASLEAALNPPRPESQMPAKFRKAMYSYFEQNFSDLTTACDNNASFDNKSMTVCSFSWLATHFLHLIWVTSLMVKNFAPGIQSSQFPEQCRTITEHLVT